MAQVVSSRNLFFSGSPQVVGVLASAPTLEAFAASEVGLRIGRSALSIWLGRRGWTFKKRPHMHWSRSEQIS